MDGGAGTIGVGIGWWLSKSGRRIVRLAACVSKQYWPQRATIEESVLKKGESKHGISFLGGSRTII